MSKPLRYLLVLGDCGAVASVRVGCSANGWECLELHFRARACRRGSTAGLMKAFQLREDQRNESVYWDEQLHSAAGMSFTLLPLIGSTEELITLTKAKLRSTRDAVGIEVVRIKHWIELGTTLDV